MDMRAALFHRHGGPEVIEVERVARPEPGPGEALVRVGAVGMNRLDLWVRGGLPIDTPLPHIGGSDVAGVVEEIVPDGGDGAGEAPAPDAAPDAAPPPRPTPRPGDRVMVNPSLWCGRCEWCRRGEESSCESFRVLGEHTPGGMAEYVVVPTRNLYPLPEHVPFETAAAAPIAFVTAWRGLMGRGRLSEGESVLITGASGGVATAAIQIAKRAGARVYAVTTTENVESVEALGADVVYDRTEVEYSREIWSDTRKRGVDVVFDSVGEATFDSAIRSLARLGRLVIYGATTGPKPTLDLPRLFWKQLEILGTTMSSADEFRTVMELIFAGELEPVVDVTWELERAREAHERLEGGEQFGNIVLVP